MERTAWTDERLDDFAARVLDEMREMRQEMRDESRAVRGEMATQFGTAHAELASLHRQVAMIGWGLAATLITALAALAAATL